MSNQSLSKVRQLASNPAPAESAAQSAPSFMNSYLACIDGACRMQAEMLGFINKRVCEDIELPVRLARCNSPADAIEHQMSFAHTMLEDYTEESRKIYDLLAETSVHISDEVDGAFCDPLPR